MSDEQQCKSPRRIDFLCMSPSEIKRILYPKDKSGLIERGKKKIWSIKHRHRKRGTTKDQRTSPRHCTQYTHLSKPWRMLTKRFGTKSDSRRIFDFLDVNQNSYWTYLEFRSWMLLIDRTLSESDIHEIFNEIDQNHDGLIQYKEFQQYFGTDLLSSEPDIVDLTILFNEIDQNHSGRITVSELLQFFNHQSPLISKEEGELFLGTMSETGNEDSISFKEFLQAMHHWKI